MYSGLEHPRPSGFVDANQLHLSCLRFFLIICYKMYLLQIKKGFILVLQYFNFSVYYIYFSDDDD